MNGERDEVADSTYGPPSNEEYFVEGESKRAYVERTIPTYMTTDIQLRFHAGRESLSVKKNITVRELKRPKERAQDRDYKQRYSISPGQQIGGFVLETRENVNPTDRERGTSHDEKYVSLIPSSGGNRSIRTPELHTKHSPPSVPSPRTGDRARIGKNLDYFTITLVLNGEQVEHRVWEDMQVSQLLQDVVGIYGIYSSLSSVVLMLYGLQPTTLRIGYRLSDPPIVTEGATVVVIHVGAPIHTHTGQRPIRYGGTSTLMQDHNR